MTLKTKLLIALAAIALLTVTEGLLVWRDGNVSQRDVKQLQQIVMGQLSAEDKMTVALWRFENHLATSGGARSETFARQGQELIHQFKANLTEAARINEKGKQWVFEEND